MVNSNIFTNGKYDEPIAPYEGLNIGDFSYEQSEIKKWIGLYCFFNGKSCILSYASSGKRKLFVCSDEKCPWAIVLSRGCKKKTNWYDDILTYYNHYHIIHYIDI